MKTLIIYLGLTMFVLGLNAQNTPSSHGLHPCGSDEPLDAWYHAFVKDIDSAPQPKSATTFVPVTIHLVGDSLGRGMMSIVSVLEAFCKLNNSYKPTNIQFYINWPIREIRNTGFSRHTTITQGRDYMLQYGVPHTMNSFISSSAAGNCGYNMRYAGNIISNSCLGGQTWAHEAGHYFNVQHPFYGWEGKNYAYNTPTPLTVICDYTHFGDSVVRPNNLYLPDTTEVEFVDRRNCAVAADKLCDTYPDYISYRWTCNGSGVSPLLQKDPAGTDFNSNGKWIMSYSNDACHTEFSANQVTLMYNYLNTQRPDLLTNQNPQQGALNSAAIRLTEPTDGDVAVPNTNIVLRWAKVPNATHYVVLVARSASFSLGYEEVLVADTFYRSTKPYPTLPAPYAYYWKVRPINQTNTCTTYGSTGSMFNTIEGDPTSVQTPQSVNFSLSPNPITAGDKVQVQLNELPIASQFDLRILDIQGRLITQQITYTNEVGDNNFLSIQSPTTSGVYFIQLLTNTSLSIKKLIVE